MTSFNLKTPTTLLVSLLVSLTCVVAQTNITVDQSDPSIQYSSGNIRNASVCKVDSNGLVVAGQAGCYNAPSQCATSIAASQSKDATAEFKFKGSAIYITGFLDFLSPIYTVTLDGNSTDVDGVRPSGPFICAPLFSSSNLDPNVEHTIQLSIKGASPNRNMTVDPQGTSFNFGLVNFIYTSNLATVSNSTTSSNGTSASSSATSSSTSATASTASKSSAKARLSVYKGNFVSIALTSIVFVAFASLL